MAANHDRTYHNLVASTRPFGVTKNVAVNDYLELRSPLYGNRYVDDRAIDCIHRIEEDPRQIYKGNPYPRNVRHNHYHIPRRTFLDDSGFKYVPEKAAPERRSQSVSSRPLSLRAATMKESQMMAKQAVTIERAYRNDYANRNSFHASVKKRTL